MNDKLFIGTSGWSYKDWAGNFYTKGVKQSEYLVHYSQSFRTVEIDSTFYGAPRPGTVEKWRQNTPHHFRFASKVPQVITHEKRLIDAESDWQNYLKTMQILGHKLGPLVLQFDYKFNPKDHYAALEQFLSDHARDARLCVEIRNRKWHETALYEMLDKHNVALVLHDLYYMPRIIKITADFTYIRLLGNRKKIPHDFSHVRINREKDLDWWADWIKKFLDKDLQVYVYSNNRYEGHAPETIRRLTNVMIK
ncbi:MAG: DUF72 domain-containing protein [Caldithrix sp.]|nr:DUF72 domain-containing protein [Caldithrix sp.]